MKVRYGVAAAFAAAIALVLILRNEGFLHGRVEGGPLSARERAASAVACKPGARRLRPACWLWTAARCEIQSVRGEFASPGLRLLGPRVGPRAAALAAARGGTPRRRPLSDGARRPVVWACARSRRGVYYVHDLVAPYQPRRYAASATRDDLGRVRSPCRRQRRPVPRRAPTPVAERPALGASVGGPSRPATPALAR